MKTEVIKIDPDYPELDMIAYCGKVIRNGGLVVFPTETVYGIAADYSNPKAMQRLREVKKREENKLFSILISQRDLISNYTCSVDPAFYKLIDKYWPGPLTVVVTDKIDEKKTIGIRIPDHVIALRLVQEAQRTIAAPSANFEGNDPPCTCQEALKDLDGLVDVAIDGGKAQIGTGSTVVDTTDHQYNILREGVITREDIDKVINKKVVVFICTGNSCRSVMAEYLLKDMVKDKKDVEVLSAGTGVFIQSTASSETISVLKEEGIQCLNHVSRPVTSILLKKADLIFVMTLAHRQQVLERVPEVEKRVYLLREFAGEPVSCPYGLDIPDPIGKNHLEYKECLDVIKGSVKKIVDLI